MNINKLKDELFQYVDDHSEDLIELCSRLIQFPSENPPGDTTDITNFIEDYLTESGLNIERYESNDKMFNLVATTGEKSMEYNNLIFCGHSDVVPAGDKSKWSFDPFSGEVKDGWLLGRGASDMKAGLGGLIFATALLSRKNIELPGCLTLAIVPDEETGGEFGVPWILEKDLIAGDGCLIAEPSSPQNPTIGQKGSYWFKLTTYGTPGHGSLSPLAGGNAIVDLIAAVQEIRKLWDIDITIPNEIRPLLKESKRYMQEVEKEREEFYPVLEHITVNIGKIEGGTKSNVIPEKCTVEIDCRLPFGITQDEVTEKISELLAPLNIDYEIERFGFKSNANYTPADDPVCKSITDNIEVVSGKEAYGVMQWASSDARHFRDYNIPVLQYGPAHLSTIHGYDERVRTEQIITCCKVYLGAAIDYLYTTK
ncbi:M20 family metallopeptidase [Corticicoccus populi]|uniref:Probable succinyl-diaminopimelate desuccinylase n=1 Tax=Corticicoccus populi TaxID=1812821 RepID=A0ABW5WVC2_9STAP